ncbi:hypothetical protein PoB_006506400 [Plakobranchus ocellatus]|uniref:Uncharacterized protein n=1 Tax=Plakobranchus ocellatus TaxID=259542 RepID=A0AAV4D2Z4_9GAST|nr:hypothetical protein PoB_006506400 [Plakobranchus ocellatus]
MNNPMLIGSLAVGVLCCVLGLVGMVTTGWLTNSVFDVGLFSLCGPRGCASYAAEDSIAAAKAFVVIGWLCALVAAINTLVYFIKYATSDVPNRTLPLIAFIFYFISGGASLLGAIIFAAGGKSEAEEAIGSSTLGYSFALTIIGALLSLAAGALMFVHRSRIGGPI